MVTDDAPSDFARFTAPDSSDLKLMLPFTAVWMFEMFTPSDSPGMCIDGKSAGGWNAVFWIRTRWIIRHRQMRRVGARHYDARIPAAVESVLQGIRMRSNVKSCEQVLADNLKRAVCLQGLASVRWATGAAPVTWTKAGSPTVPIDVEVEAVQASASCQVDGVIVYIFSIRVGWVAGSIIEVNALATPVDHEPILVDRGRVLSITDWVARNNYRITAAVLLDPLFTLAIFRIDLDLLATRMIPDGALEIKI
jgi:hypothetical protein